MMSVTKTMTINSHMSRKRTRTMTRQRKATSTCRIRNRSRNRGGLLSSTTTRWQLKRECRNNTVSRMRRMYRKMRSMRRWCRHLEISMRNVRTSKNLVRGARTPTVWEPPSRCIRTINPKLSSTTIKVVKFIRSSHKTPSPAMITTSSRQSRSSSRTPTSTHRLRVPSLTSVLTQQCTIRAMHCKCRNNCSRKCWYRCRGTSSILRLKVALLLHWCRSRKVLSSRATATRRDIPTMTSHT